jgi:ABC-2 type transport system ATP-binding protein
LLGHSRMTPLATDNLATDNLALGYRNDIEDSIAENRLSEALNTLQDFVLNLAPDLKNTVLLLRRRHSQFREDQLNNVANPKEADAIANSVLQIVTEAEQQSAIQPKYAIPASNVGRTHDGADRPSLQLVSSNDSPDHANSDSVPASTSGSQNTVLPHSTAPDDQEAIDEQLRRYWLIYRSRRPPEDTTAVICQNITKYYRGGRFSLEELSFSLKTGQITGVVGRNASGKTTLLRIVLAEISPDSGTVTYPALTRDGEGWAHLKRHIGYIPQSFDSWTGRLKTNLHFVAAAHGTTGKRNYDLVDWYIQRYGLTDYQDSTFETLSGGFRMRYEIVKALISRPRLLILDEPLAYLDVLARQEFLKNLRVIAYSLEQPVPVMVTSQNLYEIDSIADQMIVLDDGKCLFSGSLEEMQRQSSTRLYELNINMPKRSMQDRLRPSGMKIIETISDGYIVEAPENTQSKHDTKFLVDTFGDYMYGFRDITMSSRRFFVRSQH